MGTVCRAKARHGNTDNTFAVESQFVKGADTYQQGECGVQSTADAHHHVLAVGMYQAFGKTCRLDIQYLLTGRSHLCILWDEGMRIDRTQHLELRKLYGLAFYHLCLSVTLGADEGGVGMTLGA